MLNIIKSSRYVGPIRVGSVPGAGNVIARSTNSTYVCIIWLLFTAAFSVGLEQPTCFGAGDSGVLGFVSKELALLGECIFCCGHTKVYCTLLSEKSGSYLYVSVQWNMFISRLPLYNRQLTESQNGIVYISTTFGSSKGDHYRSQVPLSMNNKLFILGVTNNSVRYF